MSQMNKKPGAWKSATPAGLKTQKAFDTVKTTVGNLNRAEKAVTTAGPGQHANTMKNLHSADQANSNAQSNYLRLKDKSDPQKKLPQGQGIGAQRTTPTRPTTSAPKTGPTTAPKTGLGNSGAKPLMGNLGKMLGKKK